MTARDPDEAEMIRDGARRDFFGMSRAHAAGVDGSLAVSIRPAAGEDRVALHRLLVFSCIDVWTSHLPPEAETRFRAGDPVAAFLDAALERFEVAEFDGRVAGALLVEGECLEDLHVVGDLRGRGEGRRLFSRAEDLGARRLDVRAFNDHAIRFYERAGWLRRRTCRTAEMGFPVLTHEYVAPASRVGAPR